MNITRPHQRTNSGDSTPSTATRPSSSRESTFYADGRTSEDSADAHPRPSQHRHRSNSSHDEARGYYYGRHSNKWLFNDFSVRHTVGGAFKKIKRKVVG